MRALEPQRRASLASPASRLGGGVLVLLALVAGAVHAAPRDPGERTLPPSPLAPMTTPDSPALALEALDKKIAELDNEQENAKKELRELGPRLAGIHGRALARGRAFYKLSRAGMLPVGGGFNALVTHAMRVERARRTLSSDLAEERRLRGRGGELARSLERIARDRASLATQRSAMDSARQAAADDQRRQVAFDQAFTSAGPGGGYVAVYGGTGASADTAFGGFTAARGRLLFPVTGRAETRQAHREGTDGPGLEVRAPLGTAVRAVFAGRVAFADRYGAYGRIVILDHGEHYYSVSANLASIDVKVGDDIGSGERLGTVGDEGHGAMLYFEIRRGSQTVPAAPWLGI
ncbi:MAG: peptidoglycan DD-metalloendopeptidase family protein [Myxococcales bacterium]|nr:peptidoglycan DD-metalloendopeptidase family protein [Myxococcales bacterium]MBL0195385.1 peptidoglycan DD-metalloendopeptidase family protein [Myxococcales bacterium]HQY59948.1 peptidoglycan DD-metalloendopeptidase family protein [Polyangiaceae bacterium]